MDDVVATLDAFDRAFAAGDADALAACFASDATLLLLHGDATEGRDAIRERWRAGFERHDTSAWQTSRSIIDVHGDRAYTLSTYTETLLSRTGGPSIEVHGRLVLFLRREDDGAWRVTLAMNSHSVPMREL